MLALAGTSGRLPVGDAVARGVDFCLDHFEPFLSFLSWSIGLLTSGLESALLAVPPWTLALVFCLLALWRGGVGLLVFTALAFALVVGLGLWAQTVTTLSLVLASTLVSLLIGLPLGVWASRNDTVDRALRPVLDFMQTMPAFVYLIPAAMFFGLGRVPGAIATIIFSMPPAVRLTNLGIRQVPREMIEAGLAFGCTKRQLLFKVQLPKALPSIMAGMNQNIMLALSMVVIASMIGAGGLGNSVLRGIQRLDVGLGFEGGIGVVLLAIVLDRITQSFGDSKRPSLRERWAFLFSGQRGAP
jgi:glycine betaine/proline transport system permease protein